MNIDHKTEKASLSERDQALYGKLHVSYEDIRLAQSCANYIKKKGWHTLSFLRRGSVRIQQVAFTTTMIVAYARPFSPGRGNIDLPKRLVRGYTSEQKKMHERLLQLRNKEIAHLDADRYWVTPYTGDLISVGNIRDVFFREREINLFLRMTDDLVVRITERMEQLRLRSPSALLSPS